MRNGICPRCHCQQVYSSAHLSDKSDLYQSNTIPLSFLRTVAVDNLVCTNCGYVESYIEDKSMLAWIKDIWTKVDHKGRPSE